MPGTETQIPAPPRAILIDLDDTLIEIYRDPARAWRAVVADMLPHLQEESRVRLAEAILARVRRFLADPARRRSWRLDPPGARPPVLAEALTGIAEPEAREALARDMARRYESYHRDTMMLPAATTGLLEHLRRHEVRLGLITNGRSDVQRHKIEHFGLAPFFDHIQIEEEAGYGKPDPRAFLDSLAALGTDAAETWMVGDDIYYDIVPANALGLWTFWYDHGGRRPGHGEPGRRHRRIGAVDAIQDFLSEALSSRRETDR